MADALQLQVGGISCGNCVRAVETALLSVPGVVAASVQLDGAATVRLEGDAGVSELQAAVVAAVEDAGKSCAVVTPAPPVAEAKGLELSLELEPEPEQEPEPEAAEADDGAGVGFIKRQTSQVDVGVEGSTPKEVRIYGDVAASEAPAVALGDDELEDLDPQHAHMFHTLLDAATDANAGPRFAAELAFDQFCRAQFGVGVMGPIAQHLSAWLVLPLGYQSASRRFEILKLMERILDGTGAKSFGSALRRYGLVALEAIEGFHLSAEKTAERQGSDSALGVSAAEHEQIRYLAYCLKLRITGVRQRKFFEYTAQWRLPTTMPTLPQDPAPSGDPGEVELEWEWREVSGEHHVDVTVLMTTPDMGIGDEVILQPTAHLTCGAGRYCTATEGEVVLMFSNEFSWLTNKEVELSYRRQRRTPPASALDAAPLHASDRV